MWKDVPERRNTDMEIGKKLKDARMKSGFTQEAVAEKINMSRQTISNWENEKSYPDIISVIDNVVSSQGEKCGCEQTF